MRSLTIPRFAERLVRFGQRERSWQASLQDVSAATVRPQDFHDAIMNNGAIVLREAIPHTVLEPLTAAINAMMDHYDAIPRDIIMREMESDTPERRNQWQEILNDGVHYNMDLVAFSQGRHSLFDPVRKAGLKRLTEQAWPGKTIRENFVTNVRRMCPGDHAGYSDDPLPPHIDAMFHQHATLGINFWTPLTEAGGTAPGLAVIPIGVEETKAYMEYNPRGYDPQPPDEIGNMKLFRWRKLESLDQAGLARHYHRPTLLPGDVLAFTNYTIHTTWFEPQMTKARTSIEIRILVHN